MWMTEVVEVGHTVSVREDYQKKVHNGNTRRRSPQSRSFGIILLCLALDSTDLDRMSHWKRFHSEVRADVCEY